MLLHLFALAFQALEVEGLRELAQKVDLQARLANDEHLLLHCAAGIGRTGTLAACILVQQGTSVDDALTLVRASRPMAGPEVGPQLDLVRAVAGVS